MKRENITLLARARQSPEARCEVGLRYLTGTDGFPRHEQTALEYLGHPSLRDSADVARIVCEHLPLERIIALGHEPALLRAAGDNCLEAQFKLAVWLGVGRCQTKDADRWLSAAARGRHASAMAVEHGLRTAARGPAELELVLAVKRHTQVHVGEIAIQAGTLAATEGDHQRLVHCVRIALLCNPSPVRAVARLAMDALTLAAGKDLRVMGISTRQMEQCLDLLATEGDKDAAYLLGRALCGIPCDGRPAADFVETGNLRKGSALLLRAADGGRTEAWLHLHTVHADHRCSVANPQLSRFFLEKAASLGDAQAQRRLGALMLRAASSLKESESALHWLHEATAQGDVMAPRLLRTLVLPVTGDDAEAAQAIDRMRAIDPWLAARLRLSRDFGLTKLEALCVDPIAGKRPWGLVVGKNPFITLSKLAAPRAIPALNSGAAETLHRTALLFEAGLRDGDMFEGDWRKRSARQRLLFARLDIDEALFFAKVGSVALDALRHGPKWALRAKPSLSLALAA